MALSIALFDRPNLASLVIFMKLWVCHYHGNLEKSLANQNCLLHVHYRLDKSPVYTKIHIDVMVEDISFSFFLLLQKCPAAIVRYLVKSPNKWASPIPFYFI